MKKTIIAALAALAATFGASATDYAYTLVLNLTDGSKVNYLFEDMPVAMLNGDDLNITLASTMESVVYPIADIANMTFTKQEVDGVQAIRVTEGVSFGITPTTLDIFGLEAESDIVIYDAAGHLMAAAKAGDGICTSVDISSLTNGVYAVKAGKHSFKFIK